MNLLIWHSAINDRLLHSLKYVSVWREGDILLCIFHLKKKYFPFCGYNKDFYCFSFRYINAPTKLEMYMIIIQLFFLPFSMPLKLNCANVISYPIKYIFELP